MARTGLANCRLRNGFPDSMIRSNNSVVPNRTSCVVSDMLESPTMTCNRRYLVESAWGSSRVLIMGRARVDDDEMASCM